MYCISSLTDSLSQLQAIPQRTASLAKNPPPTSKAGKPAPKPIIKKQAAPKLKLKPLTPDQEGALRLGAVQRILASEAVPAQHLRSSVLAALASRCLTQLCHSISMMELKAIGHCMALVPSSASSACAILHQPYIRLYNIISQHTLIDMIQRHEALP